ncbi:hypothetical protein COU77_02280 [Candidatus Peregrinibacteria bacterium CG10_big_fil_rev_8_21_14_0_10_49_16]|nr:MAG: hypothetical protein COW95_03485 [Candidatus Peregrinibacteria bacterium CG22_combo_CG10-13_8_21_14_all_49_11]PIR52091.1 MAG: hypothetical protein COU77_02280 [Candidatus Peregrinibacteria bacterium CG10_big_fil_rev_8_21_14_0_10_49_16]
MADKPPEGLVLRHELLIIDANLVAPLDTARAFHTTQNLIQDLLSALGMSPLGQLETYPATDLRAPG